MHFSNWLRILTVFTISLAVFFFVLIYSSGLLNCEPDDFAHKFSMLQQISYRSNLNLSTLDKTRRNQTEVEQRNKSRRILFKQRLPKCLIIGFAKCGTYALRSFLSLHPDIVCAENETQFFSRFYHKGFDWYRHQMPFSLRHQITIEKTPNYAESKLALQRIHSFNSSLKVIAIVRDPVTRLQSSYAHFLSKGSESNMTFTAWCGNKESIVRRMDFVSHLLNVYSLFPRDQVLVLTEEVLESKPLQTMHQVETFLGLQHAFKNDVFVFNTHKGFYCLNVSYAKDRQILQNIKFDPLTGCFRKNKGRPHPHVDSTFFKYLAQLAQPYNDNLFRVIQKRFEWPTEQNNYARERTDQKT